MKILFVDDEVDLLEIAQSFFESEGIEIDITSDYSDAISKVKNSHYNAIISDANMPSGNGRELLRFFRHDLKYQGRLVLVTGDFQKNSDSQDFDLVVMKPINFFDLIDQIKSLIG
jgi:two-component system, OmpR family, response regulator QseB